MANNNDFLSPAVDLMRLAGQVDAFNTGDNEIEAFLGILVILSALLTEFEVSRVLANEADKIDAVVDAFDPATADVDAGDLAAINRSVGDVVDGLCCIERATALKVFEGIRLLRPEFWDRTAPAVEEEE